MPPRPAFAADQEVIEACRRRGLEVTARRLERMRPYLPGRQVRHVKGFRGSTSANPHGYVDHVMAFAGVLGEGVSYADAPLVLFVRRLPVDLDVMRAAYLNLLERLQEALYGTASVDTLDVESVSDRVEATAQRFAKRRTSRAWRARAHQAIRDQKSDASGVTSLLAGAWSAVFTWLIAGEAASTEGTEETLRLFGLHDGQDLSLTTEHLAGINLESLVEAVRSATWEEWSKARGDLDTLYRYIDVRQRTDYWLSDQQRIPGLKDVLADVPVLRAAQVLVLLVVGTRDRWRTRLQRHLNYYEALERYLVELPDELHHFVRGDETSPDPNKALQRHAQMWASHHPADAQILAEGLG